MRFDIRQDDVPAGEYLGVIDAITDHNGTYGPFLKWHITLQDDDVRGTSVDGITKVNVSSRAKCVKWSFALIGKTDEFNSEMLISIPCDVVIGDNGRIISLKYHEMTAAEMEGFVHSLPEVAYQREEREYRVSGRNSP